MARRSTSPTAPESLQEVERWCGREVGEAGPIMALRGNMATYSLSRLMITIVPRC